MTIVTNEVDIPCPWGGTLTGVLMKDDSMVQDQLTIKIIAIHGWLDNLNSMLPLARKLIEHHPSEISILYVRSKISLR